MTLTNDPFRSDFSRTIFKQKYAHEGAETWDELSTTLIREVCHNLMTPDEVSQLTQYMKDMKFIPGGRYLYYAGRPNPFYNNCFSAGTKVLTSEGWRNVEELGEAEVISPVDGKKKKAVFHSHGVQPLYTYTFVPVRGRSQIEYTVTATRNHKWLLKDGTTTEELQVKDVVPAGSVDLSDVTNIGFAHGFVFGDGNRNGQLRLCAEKDKKFMNVLGLHGSITYPVSADGDPVMYFPHKIDWKSLPDTKDPVYIASFIRGWLAADGSGGHLLNSVNKEHMEWFRYYAAYAGLTISGELRSQIRDIVLGEYSYKNHEIFIQNYSENWAGFKLKSIEYIGDETVYCPFEPEYNQIIIDHNIRTYQCYLLRSEEDSREDWANLSWKSEMALMTGGGIGNDYSIYRPSGARISRTGGVASGPIPKMEMVNEIGRRVMQGGSRRSAIYASLDWTHADVNDFLTVKDWDKYPVGNSGLTLKDIKEQDFNFPAPLDMTNISVNYNTEWLHQYEKTGEVGEVFKANVRQALKTAEPGFSFNFYDKERETLRNACTEVTSEDDSDVCNLGSVNLGRIDSLTEFEDVVQLATKFLLCGTLKAKLPYEKVYQVREKNRRLGLGLMGMHEWLIKKGSRYVVTPELHDWLNKYRTVSAYTARQFADTLGVSRPVAARAIAPTGTIGILAGTTTGIEPLFAVAYKRRYLKGTRWHYQYVVDGAAEQLISMYGADPESIESAVDLADDYERRIAFQADVQDYVDMSISSTINLPSWGSPLNNEDRVDDFAKTLAKYASRLRGFTCYPDGARGGQPLTSVPYAEAHNRKGQEFTEEWSDVCDITQRGGSCGV